MPESSCGLQSNFCASFSIAICHIICCTMHIHVTDCYCCFDFASQLYGVLDNDFGYATQALCQSHLVNP